jgi:hypothetical protein
MPLMRGKPKPDDDYSAEETAKRLDATVRAMIATPHKPQKTDKVSSPRRPKKGRHKKA